MRQQFFIFVEAAVGQSLKVATDIQAMNLPFMSELALISGEWDLLVRSECDSLVDVEKVLVMPIQAIGGVLRTWTEIGYPVFDPDDIDLDLD